MPSNSNVNHANHSAMLRQCGGASSSKFQVFLFLSLLLFFLTWPAQVKLPTWVSTVQGMWWVFASWVPLFFIAWVGNAWNCASDTTLSQEYDTPPEQLSLSLHAYVLCVLNHGPPPRLLPFHHLINFGVYNCNMVLWILFNSLIAIFFLILSVYGILQWSICCMFFYLLFLFFFKFCFFNASLFSQRILSFLIRDACK